MQLKEMKEQLRAAYPNATLKWKNKKAYLLAKDGRPVRGIAAINSNKDKAVKGLGQLLGVWK